MDPVEQRVKIRIASLGYKDVKALHVDLEENHSGYNRNYDWWLRLSSNSKASAISEAARYLKTSVSVLLGEQDNRLLSESKLGRINLMEG